MAALVFPAGVVTLTPGHPKNTKTCQVTLANGQGTYNDLTNGGKLNLTDADAAASARMSGLCIAGGTAGSEVVEALPGAEVTFSGAITNAVKGETYYPGGTAGSFVPFADLTTGQWCTVGLLALSTSKVRVVALIGEIQKA